MLLRRARGVGFGARGIYYNSNSFILFLHEVELVSTRATGEKPIAGTAGTRVLNLVVAYYTT